MVRATFLLLSTFGLLLLSSCSSLRGIVKDRAATDLSCPKGDIVVTSLGADSYSARGCDREQGYTCSGRIEGPKSCWPDYGYGKAAAHAVETPAQYDVPQVTRPQEDPPLPRAPDLSGGPAPFPAASPVVQVPQGQRWLANPH